MVWARRTCIGLLAVFLLAPGNRVSAQQSGTAGFPKVYEVVPDKLNLRAGIGQNYRVLVAVKRGDLLVGEEEQVGWIRVRPPKGIRCFVSRDFVDASGGTGAVNADHVNLRPTASTTHPPLLQLNRGDQVRILGEAEGWFEIEAPGAVSCWTSKEYLRESGPYTGREQTVDTAPAAARPRGDDRDGQEVTPEAPVGADLGAAAPAEREEPTRGPLPGGTEPVATGPDATSGTEEFPPVREPGIDEPPGTEPGGRDPMAEQGGDTGAEPGGAAATDPLAGTEEPIEPPSADGRATFDEAMRLTRVEDEKEVRDQDYRRAIGRFEAAMAAGLSADLRLRADIELKRLQANQKILDELRSQDRELRAISEAERRRQREESAKGKTEPFLAEGWLDGVGKVINRPAAHKLVKGKKTLYYLTSLRLNLNDYYGKRVGVRGKTIDAPGWPYRVIIVDSLEVLGE